MDCNSFTPKNYIARPYQSLFRHLRNSADQMESALERTRIFYIDDGTHINMDPGFLDLYLRFTVGIHDFGKLNRPFQQKILHVQDRKRPKLEDVCIPFSFHAQIGGLFSWLLLREFLQHARIEDDTLILAHVVGGGSPNLNTVVRGIVATGDSHAESMGQVPEELEILMAAISSLSVLMHHHKGLDNYSDAFFRDIKGHNFEEVISAIVEDIRDQFSSGILDIETIFGSVVDHPLWRHCFSRAFSKLITDDLEDIIDDYIEVCGEELPELLSARRDPFFTLFFSYVYSVLCDVDEWDAKSYINDTPQHTLNFEQEVVHLSPNLIHIYKDLRFKGFTPRSSGEQILINLRNSLFNDVVAGISGLSTEDIESSLFFIDAPTGSGKTLALLQAGLMLRERKGYSPRIIYALPFISIIEQVGTEIREVYEKNDISVPEDQNTQYLVMHHHLNDSSWVALEVEEDEESIVFGETLSQFENHHYVNNWHPEVIVTSFVKLLNTLVKAHKREFIRAHRLYSSVVLVDEVQGIPVEYWDLVAKVFEGMTRVFNCSFVIASATNPKVIFQNTSLKRIDLFSKRVNLDRYVVRLDCFDGNQLRTTQLSEFVDRLQEEEDNSLLVVLNTTRSAFSVYDSLQKSGVDGLFLLSTQLLPVHRMEVIQEIRDRMERGERTVVVSTQVIEAGVNLSFDKVYRDFAPLDSIIQVAGRCNRHGLLEDPGEVVLVSLADGGRRFASQVYGKLKVNLETTKSMLLDYESLIKESEISALAEGYFRKVKQKRRTSNLLEEYLTGKFSVLNQQFKLIEEMDNRVPVIFEIEENKKLIEMLYIKKKTRHIPNRVRLYVVEVSKKVLDGICNDLEEHKQYRVFSSKKGGKKGTKGEDKIYLIRLWKLDEPEKIYSKYGGVRMASMVTDDENTNSL